MTALVLMAGYGAGCVVLFCILLLVNQAIWENTFISPPEEEAWDDFELHLPEHVFWAFQLTQAIEIISSAITKAGQEISRLENLPEVRLGIWDKICVFCARIRSWLWIYVLVAVDLIFAAWLVFMGVAFWALFTYDQILTDYSRLTDLILPQMREYLQLTILATCAGLGLLALGVVVWVLARVSSSRLKAYRARKKGFETDIPLLENRIVWLEDLKADKIHELRRSRAVHRELYPS